MSGAPQSGEDVEAVVRELRLLDPRLNVRWEPKAIMVRRGRYSATGQVIDPVYDGRWEIILNDKAFSTAEWRDWTRVCFVTQQTRIAAGLMAMAQDGAYAPLDQSVVEFMRQADRHNNDEARRLRERIDALNARQDQREMDAGDDALEEAASKQYHVGTKAGGGVSSTR